VLENARWVILDMWKTGLHQTPSHLDRKLYYRDCPAGFFFYPNPKENNWESLSLKPWGPEQREILASGEIRGGEKRNDTPEVH
jgi:hypothetical protein